MNTFADQLTFLSDKTWTRRGHMKYLTLLRCFAASLLRCFAASLLRCIALLHQYQRTIKHIVHRGKSLAFIEVTQGDIVLAACSTNWV